MRALVPLLLALAAPLQAAPPPLALMGSGFPAGDYAISATRGGGPAQRQCLATPDLILFGAERLPPGCRLTVVEDTPDRAVLSWTCANGSSGRSEIRRDHAGLFVSQIQGVSGRLPYVLRRSFLLLGPCADAQSKSRSPDSGATR